MRYVFLLRPHANIRYRASEEKLAVRELSALLSACGITSPVEERQLGGGTFLSFEADPIPAKHLRLLCSHSCVCFFAVEEDGLLRPLSPPTEQYLPDDLPEILKYKGKTSPAFTSMMLNCALATSDYAFSAEPITVLDPICGKGTSLFCAACRGMNAVGVEQDKQALREGADFFEKYLCQSRRKNEKKTGSLTIPGEKPAGDTLITYADTAEHYKAGDTRSLRFLLADTSRIPRLLKPASCQLLVADLPYGVQHAPHEEKGLSSFSSFLSASLSGWYRALAPGGAAAISFNTYTLKREELIRLMTDAGFKVNDTFPYDDFSHWVEQAVNRDLVVAIK